MGKVMEAMVVEGVHEGLGPDERSTNTLLQRSKVNTVQLCWRKKQCVRSVFQS
jgi:hypothetical protein